MVQGIGAVLLKNANNAMIQITQASVLICSQTLTFGLGGEPRSIRTKGETSDGND
jgi:hypothetical protein